LVQSGQACGLGGEWRAAPDPGGSAAVAPACGPPCTEWSPAASRTAQGVRWNAPKGDGGGSRPCRRRDPTAPGVWSPHGSPTGSPRVAGSKGHAPKGRRQSRRGRRQRGCGDDGAAVVLARVPLSGQGARDVRARASAGVRTRVGVIDTGFGPARVGNRRSGGA
jgi:hypothetical protein